MLGEIKYMFEFEASFLSFPLKSLRDYKHANVTKPPPLKTKPFLHFLLSLCLLNFAREGRESLGRAITERAREVKSGAEMNKGRQIALLSLPCVTAI